MSVGASMKHTIMHGMQNKSYHMAPHILPAMPKSVHSRLAEESQNLMSFDRGNIPSCDDNIKSFVPSGNACQCRSIASCVKSMLFAHHPPFLLLALFLGLPLLVGGGHPRLRFLLFAMLLMWCEFDCKKLETTGCWENAGATISFTDAIHAMPCQDYGSSGNRGRLHLVASCLIECVRAIFGVVDLPHVFRINQNNSPIMTDQTNISLFGIYIW